MIEGALVLVDMYSEVPVQFWNIEVRDKYEKDETQNFTEHQHIYNLMTVSKSITIFLDIHQRL